MSSATGKQMFRASALRIAEAFRALFPASCYRRWEFAGSLRRHTAAVGDLEHVVMPAFDPISDDLWGRPMGTSNLRTSNLLWRRLNELLAQGIVCQHVYGDRENGLRAPTIRWGEKYRGADFEGVNCEIFCADQSNWGSVLAIRTGPAKFSTWLQTRLHRSYRRNWQGYVWDCRRCPRCEQHPCEHCTVCQGTGLEPRTRLEVPTEAEYFRLASSLQYLEPEERT